MISSRGRDSRRAFTVALSDDIQLSQMFVKLFGDRQVAVDPKIIAYLVARMERSPEEAVALADLMDRLALAAGTAITRSDRRRSARPQRGARRATNWIWKADDDE